MSKKVTIGLKMDSHFINLLNTNVGLSNLKNKAELDPMQQLAILVLQEARGALEEQVSASIRNMWKPNIEVVSDLRKVEQYE